MLGQTINVEGLPECSDRKAILKSAQGPLKEGQIILYIEVALFPYPHLQNCKVTVGPDEAKP